MIALGAPKGVPVAEEEYEMVPETAVTQPAPEAEVSQPITPAPAQTKVKRGKKGKSDSDGTPADQDVPADDIPF